MDIHPEIMGILNETVLPNVLRVHGMGIPYPAELWANGVCQHQDGAVVFTVSDRGFLNAEYFGYDNYMDPLLAVSIGIDQTDAKLVMKDTRFEIFFLHLRLCLPAVR